MSKIASTVLGGIGAAAQGRSDRKAAAKQAKQDAVEKEKDRQLQRDLANQQLQRYKDAAASWSKYEFGAPPLIARQQPAAPSQPAPAVAQPQPAQTPFQMSSLMSRGIR